MEALVNAVADKVAERMQPAMPPSSNITTATPPMPPAVTLPTTIQQPASPPIAQSSATSPGFIVQPSPLIIPAPERPNGMASDDQAAAVANRAITDLLAGESPSALVQPPPYAYARLSAPLGAHVSVSLRAKIWTNDFVQLQELLPPNLTFMQLAANTAKAKPSTRASDGKATQPAMSFADYLTAFHIYIAIRVQKYPHEAAGMLKHLEVVREMRRTFGYNMTPRSGQPCSLIQQCNGGR
jgi:hypothetical protein